MKLTGTFALTAAVNVERRTIIGQVIPFGEVGYPGLNGQGVRLVVEAGGLVWDDPTTVRLRSTHHTEPIGRAVTLDPGPDGIIGSFKVADTQAGTDSLTLAAEGLQAGLSFEADVPDGLVASDDGLYTLTAATPATLTAVALVESPAFASAQVHKVAAQKESPVMAEKVTAAEVPDEVVSTLVTAFQALVESQTATADPAAEAPAEAPAEAATTLPTRRFTAATQVTREPFPYGHPGAEGAGLFADLWASKNGNAAATIRAEKARDMLAGVGARITAANEPVAQTDVTIPNVYQDALLVNLPDFPRDFADNIPSTAIDSARPILVPVVDGVTADGGSGEVVTAHTEGTNPAQGEVDIDYDTYTPVLYSGMFDINREALDAGSPGMDALLLGFLSRSYRNVTDTAAYTAIAGYSGIDTGSSGTDASNTVEAQNMVSTILAEMGNFKARAGYSANICWMAPSEFVDVTSLNATDGRPLFPYVNPQNTTGQASQANYGDIYINGVRTINAVNAATTKVIVANTAALHRWESPVLNFEWPEVVGPAKIRFALAGYHLTSVLDARGVSLITQA